MYTPMLYDDIDEKLHIFKSFGKSIKSSLHFTIRPRSNFILWDKLVDEPELVKDLHIGNDIDPSIRQSIINIIQKNWDSFYKRGVSQPMLYLEFYIDTGNSPPVCCTTSI